MDSLDSILKTNSNTKFKTFKKGEILQTGGEKNPVGYFVKKGLLRSYTIDEKGKEHIIIFASEGWLIADAESEGFELPNQVYIDCIENSEVLIFNKDHFNINDLTNEQLEENFRLMERRIAALQRRVVMLMSSSAKDRYNKFLKSHPELPNRVPQRMIASYLGITPQALSKIRGEIIREK
jgi:CRP-like cAMP-binding protein